MVNELSLAIKDGHRIYQNHTSLYYQMLVNGISHIIQNFSWDKAAREYARHLE